MNLFDDVCPYKLFVCDHISYILYLKNKIKNTYFRIILQLRTTTMMPSCPIPGLSFARVPGTSLKGRRFQDPVKSEGKPQPKTAAWTRAGGRPAVAPSPTIRSKVLTKPAPSPRVKGNVL